MTPRLGVSLLLLLSFLSSQFIFTESACQSCLLPILPHPHRHRHPSRWGVTLSPNHPRLVMIATASGSGIVALRNLRKSLVQRSMVVAVAGLVTVTVWRTVHWSHDPTRDKPKDEDSTAKEDNANETETKDPRPPLTTAMVATIGVYKNFISPLLPPACRFLPTCSQYGVQAIEEFGPTKGAILTAWRLLRCSPLGGKGYDPPRWPPVKYTYGSY